jgi:(p)ppGpp synthase/HD superfamily hydrolase
MGTFNIYGALLMTYNDPIERAVALAVKAHSGQVDKQGQPYILHVLRVGLAGTTEEEKVTGILHDILEDTEWTVEDLYKLKFSYKCVPAIIALTHTRNLTHTDYYNQILTNDLALRVKKNDIDDNYGRLSTVRDVTTRERLRKKYDFAREFLFNEKPVTTYY